MAITMGKHRAETECGEKRKQEAATHGAGEERCLQHPAQRGHDGHDREHGDKRWQAEFLHGEQHQIGAEDGKVSMGEVDKADDAEHQCEP